MGSAAGDRTRRLHGHPRGRYGIDSGVIPVALFGLSGTALTGVVVWSTRRRRRGVGVTATAAAAGYLHSTGPGKRAAWARLLDDLHLDGDEQILDIGCDRGAV
jgi:arsenite methyltransferase